MHARRVLLTLLFASVPVQSSADFVGSWQEYATVGMVLGASAILSTWPPNTSHALINSDVKSYVKRERVPNWTGATVGLATLSAIRVLPGGTVSRTHSHGFVMAVSMNALATSLAKGITGRKRPNYDDARATGHSDDTDTGSFWSGHASNSFCLATYTSLYAWSHAPRPVGVAVPLIAYTGAIYTAWSRVAEHRHHTSDVLVGAIAGTITSTLVYRWYDGMSTSTSTTRRATLVPSPRGITLLIPIP
jgi:hypothetical protein